MPHKIQVAVEVAVHYRFGQFELIPEERRLLADGIPVRLAPRDFNLLLALVQNEGRLATKRLLFEKVWPGVIVEENSLHHGIATLRKILGAEAISTVTGSGYRLAIDLVQTEEKSQVEANTASRHNLVRQLTSFVGRKPQIAELKGLLQRTQLLTLSGAGGCGKTRLALELASQLVDVYADGVRFVELAPIEDEGHLPQAVAVALALERHGDESLAQSVLNHLASKNLLLVLDNAEHLLEACGNFAHMALQRCTGVTVVVTSRERLRIMGELVYRVPSLSVPNPHQTHDVESLVAYESARLFIERARLYQPHFAATAQSSPTIASVCARLDGIPLAIELAAARLRALSVEEVNERLDQRFRLLTDQSRAVLPRHRTLRALIDWSYDLLNEAEKAVLCRASVFSGGFTIDAAERILSDHTADKTEMLDLLTSLTDKSLLQAEQQSGRTRYRLLETVRQYGRDRLRECGGDSSWQRRHLDHFVAYAEAAEELGRSGQHKAGFDRFHAERDDLRAALATASAQQDESVEGLRLAGAMFPFWLHTPLHWNEARSWLQHFLEAVPAGAADSARAKALNAAGALAINQGDSKAARSQLEECVAIRRRLGDRRRLAAALYNLTQVLDNAGAVSEACAMAEETLAIGREFGVPMLITGMLAMLTFMSCEQGEVARARVFAEEAVQIAREEGGNTLADALHPLAWVVLQGGDAERAVKLCQDALRACDFGQLYPLNLLDTTAFVECASGRVLRAAVIWGHTQGQRAETHGEIPRRAAEHYERTVPAARVALGNDAAFDDAWRKGAAMSTESVIEFVLRSCESPFSTEDAQISGAG